MVVPVLVVGAGVAGCVLALELAHHGVASTVLERAARPPRHPDLNLLDGRTMELLRRLGLADGLRPHGVGPDVPADVVFSRRLDQPPIHVRHGPSANQLRERHASGADPGAPGEPYLLLSGEDLAGRLLAAARAHPLIDLRTGWTFTDLRLEGGGAVVAALEAGTGIRHAVRARFVAGCDGAQSTVRRCLGVRLEGLRPPAPYLSVYLRGRLERGGGESATIIVGGVTMCRRREDDVWVGHLPLAPEDGAVTDPATLVRERLGLGPEGPGTAGFEVLGVVQWDDALGVASTYRLGPAYLVGQAAHRFHPPSISAATCVGDAVDLGWKLAATVNGWGGPALLASYEQERRRRALLEREMVARALETRQRFGRLAAAGAPSDVLAEVAGEEPPQVDLDGTATAYEQSPVLWSETADPRPATRPGARPPAVRLAGGESVFDRLGPQFTLVDLSAGDDGKVLVTSARDRGIPMTHLPLADADMRATWASRLVLVRPDQHIAWRGDELPADWERVLDVVTGRRPQEYANT